MRIDWDMLMARQKAIYQQVESKLQELQVGESLAMRIETPPPHSMESSVTLVLRVVRPGDVMDDGPWTIYGPMEEHHKRTMEGRGAERIAAAYADDPESEPAHYYWKK